jgi:hypothetical protein
MVMAGLANLEDVTCEPNAVVSPELAAQGISLTAVGRLARYLPDAC